MKILLKNPKLLFAIAVVTFMASGVYAYYEPGQGSAPNGGGFLFEIQYPTVFGVQPQFAEGPAGYVRYLFLFGLAIGGILAFAMIVVGGIQYAMSAGNVSQISDAKDRITQAILGLLLLLASYLILSTINPALVSLRNPELGTPPPLSPLPPANWDEGWTFMPAALEKKNDASTALRNLLSCMGIRFDDNKIPRSSMVITSISDGNIPRSCNPNLSNVLIIDGKRSDIPCPPNASHNTCYFWNDQFCQHRKGSCHYGGALGFDFSGGSSYAIDVGLNNSAFISQVARSCNAKVVNEGNHLHITIGHLYANCDLLFF
ncbi:MAG: hypothetical protein ACK4NX_00210 [Candidatus Paceibacteria bacterium]